jgi:hypothetical protein
MLNPDLSGCYRLGAARTTIRERFAAVEVGNWSNFYCGGEVRMGFTRVAPCLSPYKVVLLSSIVLPIGDSAAYSATLFENYLERITADPSIADPMTRGDPVATAMPEDDHAAGGNDDPDGSLLARVASQSADDTAPMRSAQSYTGPIGAASSSGGALGEMWAAPTRRVARYQAWVVRLGAWGANAPIRADTAIARI